MDTTFTDAINEILNPITTFVSEVTLWVSGFVDFIVEQPILFIFCVAVPLCGLGVGLLRRLIHT